MELGLDGVYGGIVGMGADEVNGGMLVAWFREFEAKTRKRPREGGV